MYLLDNLKFDPEIQRVVGEIQYPFGWFRDTLEREKIGVIEVPDPVKPDDDIFTYVENPDGSYTTTERTPEDLAARLEAKTARHAASIAGKIDSLWAAADRYVTGYISGVAIGILAIGVIQGKPKALAVTAWSNAIWSDYYVRKELITSNEQPNLDFSSHGSMPHTVPELQDEIGL